MKTTVTLSLIALLFIGHGLEAADETARIKLKLSPQATPRYGLQYELLPPLKSQRSGNAALAYYNIILANRNSGLKEILEAADKEDDLTKTAQRLGQYQRTLADLARAASYKHCDWQAHLEDGFGALLPYLADLRRLSQLALLQAKIDLANGEHDRAIGQMQTGLAIARHAAQDRTLIGNLVGIAVAKMVFSTLESNAQTKGAPNLYWALSDLPRPYFRMRDAMRWERSWHEFQIPELGALKSDLSQADIGRIPVAKIARMMKESIGQDPYAIDKAASESARQATLADARNRLSILGVGPEKLAKLSRLETICLADFDRAQELSHDLFKWANLPYPQSHSKISGVVAEAMKWAKKKRGGYDPFPFHMFYPALAKANQRFATTERELDAWRCIEAIRAHAAANGKLPNSLGDIKGLHIPLNPMTGKAFGYELQGRTAVLTAGTPPKHDARETVIYELTVN